MPATAGVAAGHALTAATAADVLRAGGNAFDAAIAAVVTACVCEPVLASPGGGGFLTALDSDGKSICYDFFAQTPQQRCADGESFYPVEVDFGDATQCFHIGPGASATPGLIKGLFTVHRDCGRMPLRELFAPAIAHARNGVLINAYQSYLLGIVAPIYTATPAACDLFCRDSKSQQLLGEGDSLRLEALADLLETLAIEGDALFYRGELAEAIVQQCVGEGGHLRHEDLRDYAVLRREPLQTNYRDCRVLINPPPSSGGALIGFALQLLEGSLRDGVEFGSAEYWLTVANAMQLTTRARSDGMLHGDKSLESLLAPEQLARYRDECVQRSAALRGTTHISTIDQWGNHAALTVSNGEGCGFVVPGGGFMLNNMLGEEDINPAGFGQWQPSERMTSMMAPGILQKRDGSQSWAIGSGGSNRIRSAIMQVISNLVDFSLPVAEAVAAARIHVEGQHLSVESGIAPGVVEQLISTYPEHTRWSGQNMFFGGAHTVERNSSGAVCGSADTRRGGCFIAV